MDKPPLGIMPRKLWDEKRMVDLVDASRRYKKAGMDIPTEWQEEYAELVTRWYG